MPVDLTVMMPERVEGWLAVEVAVVTEREHRLGVGVGAGGIGSRTLTVAGL